MNSERLSLEDFRVLQEFQGNPSNKIYLVEDRESAQKFIFKQIRLTQPQSQLREVQAQKNLRHRFVIALLRYRVREDSLEMLIEYAPNGDLFDFINNLRVIYEFTLLELFYKIVIAIDFMHGNGFIHRDIKPENIMIGADSDPKLADFGSSVRSKVVRNTFCGTYEYMAPEVYMRERQTEKVDIWALGILIFEMTHNATPFKGKNLFEIKHMIESRELPFDPQISSRVRQIVWKILRVDPKLRPSAREILGFPEFNVISSKFAHLIPQRSVEDRLNFGLLKGRILTFNDSGKERERQKQVEREAHEKLGFDEKKMLTRELVDFKANFRLPPSVARRLEQTLGVRSQVTAEYDYHDPQEQSHSQSKERSEESSQHKSGSDNCRDNSENESSSVNIYRQSDSTRAGAGTGTGTGALNKTVEKGRLPVARDKLSDKRKTKAKQSKRRNCGRRKLGKNFQTVFNNLFGHQKTLSKNLLTRGPKQSGLPRFLQSQQKVGPESSLSKQKNANFSSKKLATHLKAFALKKIEKEKLNAEAIYKSAEGPKANPSATCKPGNAFRRNKFRSGESSKNGRKLQISTGESRAKAKAKKGSKLKARPRNSKFSSLREIQGFSFGKIIRKMVDAKGTRPAKQTPSAQAPCESNLSKFLRARARRQRGPAKPSCRKSNLKGRKPLWRRGKKCPNLKPGDLSMRSMQSFAQSKWSSGSKKEPKAKMHSQKRIADAYQMLSFSNVSSNHVNEYNFSAQISMGFPQSFRRLPSRAPRPKALPKDGRAKAPAKKRQSPEAGDLTQERRQGKVHLGRKVLKNSLNL